MKGSDDMTDFPIPYANEPTQTFNPIAHVKAYCGTGFSGLNTPASPQELIEAAEKVLSLPDINCLPLIGQTNATINIPAFDDIINTDYMSIEFNGLVTYWLRGGYNYLAGDTISVGLTLDGFLTIGGVSGIESASGYIRRRTTPTDDFGQYDQDDPMIAPAQALKIRQVSDAGVLNDLTEDTILLSTIDLYSIGVATETEFKEKFGLTYGDGTNTVTAPNFPPVYVETVISLEGARRVYKVPSVQFFISPDRPYGFNSELNIGISRARSVGVDEPVLDQYTVPHELFTITKGVPEQTDAPFITKIVAHERTATPAIDFKGYYTPNNKKTLYGQYTKLVLMAIASGESYEFRLEDLDTDNFTIAVFGDPRSNGLPIIYPKKYKGQAQSASNMLACVRGLQWNKAPIRYEGATGSAVSYAKYEANTAMSKQEFEQGQVLAGMEWGNNRANMTLDLIGHVTSLPETGIIQGAANAARTIVNGAYYNERMMQEQQNNVDNWNRRRAMEKQELMFQNNLVSPTIAHAPVPSLRDFTGNGAILVLTTPTDEDLKRFDKIYNMFGYYDPGTPLTLSDFSNGLNWTYLEASHVQLRPKGNFGRFIVQQAEAQIEAGIRIWNRKPDFSLYDQSNRKEAS